MQGLQCGCSYRFGVFFAGVLATRVLLCGSILGAPDLWKLACNQCNPFFEFLMAPSELGNLRDAQLSLQVVFALAAVVDQVCRSARRDRRTRGKEGLLK